MSRHPTFIGAVQVLCVIGCLALLGCGDGIARVHAQPSPSDDPRLLPTAANDNSEGTIEFYNNTGLCYGVVPTTLPFTSGVCQSSPALIAESYPSFMITLFNPELNGYIVNYYADSACATFSAGTAYEGVNECAELEPSVGTVWAYHITPNSASAPDTQTTSDTSKVMQHGIRQASSRRVPPLLAAVKKTILLKEEY